MRNVRKEQLNSNKKGRKIIYLTVSMLLFIYLTFIMIVGDNGLLKYLELKSTRDKLLAENIVIQEQNLDMKDSVESYDNEPDQYEGLAREYGLTKEGELIFKFDNKE